MCSPAWTPVSFGILLYLGIFQLALGYILMSKALPHVPALEVSLLLLIELVVSPVWAFLLVREVRGVVAGGRWDHPGGDGVEHKKQVLRSRYGARSG